MDTTLINIEDIKTVTSISQNIDVEMLEPFLFNAQEMYIRPICGDALMDAMLVDVATGGTAYSTLINNQIIYALSYSVVHSFLPFNHIKIQKKGVLLQTSDSSTSASMDEFTMLSQRIENSQTFYLRRMKDYLDDNLTLYPLYAKDDQITPTSSSSIFLGFA